MIGYLIKIDPFIAKAYRDGTYFEKIACCVKLSAYYLMTQVQNTLKRSVPSFI